MPLCDKAFYFAIFFILGVGAAGFGITIWFNLIIVAVVGRFIFSLGFKWVLISCLICSVGYFYYNLYGVLHTDKISLGEETAYTGLVMSEPEYGIKSTALDLELDEPHQGVLRVYLPPTDSIHYGDVISFSGVAEKLYGGKINIISFPDDVVTLEIGRGDRIKEILFGVKGRLIDNLKTVLPPEKAALMSGILLGERAEFTPALEEAMRLSGTTHIVALSGYNIAILAATLSSGLAYICNRRKAFWLSLIAIPVFVIMTGAEASVIRAGVMGLIMLLAVQQGRIYSFRNAITLTAAVMLIYNPELLSKDVGFQLSFAALLGIIYVYPWLTKKLKWKSGGFLNWRTNALQTLAAQLTVLPIVLSTFGFVSPTAPISNILILEFIPLTMLVGFLVAMTGFFSYYLSFFFGWAANLLLSYEIFIIKFFAPNWF
jgi:competence protein ComEC